MIQSRISQIIKELWRQGIKFAHKLDERSHGWLGVLATATKETLMPDTAMMASAISYIALFTLFPIILLSISIASFRFGPSIDEHIIIQQLEFVAPALSQLLGRNIDEIIRARGPATTFALLSLTWSASTIFYTLTHSLNKIWNIQQRRSAWKVRGLAILVVLAFIGPTLFLISFAGTVITNLHLWLPDQILPIGEGLSLILSILLDISLFMLLYMLLPHGTSTWREILPGALGAGILWELAKKSFLSFISTYISISNLVYGTVATIIAFLFWAYLSSLIFLFGAYLSVAYWKLIHKQKLDK